MLRWLVLSFLVLGLAGCSAWKKGNAKLGAGNSSPGQLTPTYEWKRPPEDLPRATIQEKVDPF